MGCNNITHRIKSHNKSKTFSWFKPYIAFEEIIRDYTVENAANVAIVGKGFAMLRPINIITNLTIGYGRKTW